MYSGYKKQKQNNHKCMYNYLSSCILDIVIAKPCSDSSQPTMIISDFILS